MPDQPGDLASSNEASDLLWSAAEAQAFDGYLQAECGLPAALLMENAGAALAREIRRRAGDCKAARLLVLAGPGNNGGDALVASRHLHPDMELAIRAPLGVARKSHASPARALEAARAVGLELQEGPLSAAEAARAELVVDGLFGIGLARPVTGAAAAAVQAIAASRAPVLAVDVPSGMHTDTGEALGSALPARWTLTFVGLKKGFATPAGERLCGDVSVAQIGVSVTFAGRWLRHHRARSGRGAGGVRG